MAPRFALSCSEGLLRDVAAAAGEQSLLVHTHCSEQLEEVVSYDLGRILGVEGNKP